jgi:CBS domain-containing protein
MTWPANLDALTTADVMHRHLTTLPPDTTVAELREYFAASGSRRLALVADAGTYVGSIEPSSLPREADGASPIANFATLPTTIAPDTPAAEARDRGLATPSRRLPVVDEAGRLVGIVAITRNLDGFCGSLSD